MPRKYHKIPQVAMAQACDQAQSFSRSLEYLITRGISATNISLELGVSRREVYEWRSGRFMPRHPLVFLAVIAWAECLRQYAAYTQALNVPEEGGKR